MSLDAPPGAGGLNGLLLLERAGETFMESLPLAVWPNPPARPDQGVAVVETGSVATVTPTRLEPVGTPSMYRLEPVGHHD